MRRLDLYVFRQLVTPLTVGLIVVTTLVWLTQSLQRLELVIEHGEGWLEFLWLTVLLIPNLLVVVLPFAVFGACLFALQRLHADSEIAVMYASGVSRLRLAAPVLLVAMGAAGATLWINLDLMPRCYRALKYEIASIRADFASSVLRSGEFTTAADGFTVYVEEALPRGQFRGLLINDYRNPKKVETYMAERGVLRDTDAGPLIYLFDGNIQTPSENGTSVNIVQFDQSAFNISGFRRDPRDLQLEMTERYLGELLNPDLSNAWARRNAAMLKAEGHGRLASPFYPVLYALIALYALLGGAYNRRGYGARIASAAAAAGGVKIAAFFAQGLAAEYGAYWLIYALPAAPLLLFLYLLTDRGWTAARTNAGDGIGARLIGLSRA